MKKLTAYLMLRIAHEKHNPQMTQMAADTQKPDEQRVGWGELANPNANGSAPSCWGSFLTPTYGPTALRCDPP